MPFIPHSPTYGSQSRPKLAPAEFDRTQAALAVTTAIAEAAVPKGALVFNVKDYGAVCDWTSGTTGTVNNTAINACLTAASAASASNLSGPAARVLVPAGTGNGYAINDTIVTPPGVEWDMAAPLVFIGSGVTALTVGSSSAQWYRNHRIRLTRYVVTDWSSEADAGLVIRNHYASSFDIVQCSKFTVGVTLMGDTVTGFSYNKVFLGSLQDNKVAIDLTNDTTGWCNENSIYGGRFAVSGATNTSLDRYGIRFSSRASTKYYNNSNKFYSPSFELGGTTIAGNSVLVQADYGNLNLITGARHELNSPEVMVQNNASSNNVLELVYADLGAVSYPVLVNNGTTSTGRVKVQYLSMVDDARRTIRKAEAIHRSACYYDGSTQVNLPGLTVGTSATSNTDARAVDGITIASDYVEFSTRYCGFYMSTRTLKRFVLMADFDAGYGGRWMIRCYDNTGAIISTAGTVKTTSAGNTPTYATSYGGAFASLVDTASPGNFGVSAETDYVFVGIRGGTAPARIRSFSVSTLDTFDPSTWLALPDYGKNYGTTPPTTGTWEVGREIVNAAPVSGSPISWVCTAAGTPGTWFALISASGTPTPDIQVFTSLSIPTGAVAQNFDRRLASVGLPAATSGRLVLVGMPLLSGDVVTSMTFFSGSTALAGGTHGWGALYSPARALLGQSADDASVAWAANTAKTFTLTSPYTVPTTGMYYVGYCLVATTMPSTTGVSPANVIGAVAPVLAGFSTSSLTGTAPGTASTLSSSTATPYCYVS